MRIDSLGRHRPDKLRSWIDPSRAAARRAAPPPEPHQDRVGDLQGKRKDLVEAFVACGARIEQERADRKTVRAENDAVLERRTAAQVTDRLNASARRRDRL
jgi:hypothetical protein